MSTIHFSKVQNCNMWLGSTDPAKAEAVKGAFSVAFPRLSVPVGAKTDQYRLWILQSPIKPKATVQMYCTGVIKIDNLEVEKLQVK